MNYTMEPYNGFMTNYDTQGDEVWRHLAVINQEIVPMLLSLSWVEDFPMHDNATADLV